MVGLKTPQKENIVRILPDCHWELKSLFNRCGVIAGVEGDKARIFMGDGTFFDLPFDYFRVLSDRDEEACSLIFRLSELSRSKYLEKGEVVIDILSDFLKRPYPKLNEQEENFLSVVETYVEWKELEEILAEEDD